MSDALDARVEAGIAILSAVVFIAILVFAGVSTSDFGTAGAYTVVAAIVVFILGMAGVGFWISTKESEEVEEDESTEADGDDA
jgi:cell division protein FtsW (lipid II flippase)